MSTSMPRGPENDEGPASEPNPTAFLERALELLPKADPPVLVGLVLLYAMTQSVAPEKVMVLIPCTVAPVIIWRVLQRLRWV
ncbi:hypothetical protein [Streptomyces sp. FH025]|uniref:hypothetical protein n=1 Tax=Streptomyces sp. FH025 TaxID=2815937 RepID=UPI001A9DE08A|nr:hypothetical protein [Streptomyces sp. FH025]MBO1417411.1 hypothetical protein [Streptomyces sp. FH025]